MIKKLHTAATVFIGCYLVFGSQLATAQLDNLSSNVFTFQQKLANNGNVHSQTKLGEMLEAGTGVKQDIAQARQWYQKAADAGYKPAKNRLIHLDIKTNGYDASKHADWVASIKADANNKDRDSMLLLAQMYREGMGVKKDFPAAKNILDTLSISGNMSIDNEITLLDAEIRANKKREQELTKENAEAEKRAEADRKKQSEEAEKQKQAEAQAAAKAAAQAKAKAIEASKTKEEIAEEKRKRYEEVMRKLKEEELILKQQQKWAEDRQ